MPTSPWWSTGCSTASLATGQSQLALALKDSVAKLTLQDMLLYGGRGRGVLTFDASGQEPATGAELILDNVLCRPLLKDASAWNG